MLQVEEACSFGFAIEVFGALQGDQVHELIIGHSISPWIVGWVVVQVHEVSWSSLERILGESLDDCPSEVQILEIWLLIKVLESSSRGESSCQSIQVHELIIGHTISPRVVGWVVVQVHEVSIEILLQVEETGSLGFAVEVFGALQGDQILEVILRQVLEMKSKIWYELDLTKSS